MAIPRKQIGWSNESNLLWQISSQLEKLTGVAYNSSGGSVAGIDTVLAQAQPLTASRFIETDGYPFQLNAFTNPTAIFYSDGSIIVGDINGVNTGTQLYVETSNERIRTIHEGNDKGIRLNFSSDLYEFGDVDNVTGSAVLKINSAAGSIQTFNGNDVIGLNIDFANNSYKIGDFAGTSNMTYINVDDSAQTTTINGYNIALSDDNNGTLTSNSAGSDSGNFLIITINGTPYKINLLNAS